MRVCSWESSQLPNLTHGVRLLALVLYVPRCTLDTRARMGSQGLGRSDGTKTCRRGSTEKGSALVKRLMLVRIQSSAPYMNLDGVTDRTGLS